jgi:tetratricopeptide (TPR) repeat protein
LGDTSGTAAALSWLGYIYRDQGQLETAGRLTEESIALYDILGNRAKMAHGQLALGWLHFYCGRYAEACELFKESVTAFAELGLPDPIIAPRISLGLATMEMGRYSEGRTLVQAHIAQSRTAHNQHQTAFGLVAMAGLAIIDAQYVEAEQLAIESSAIYQEIKDPDRKAMANVLYGFAQRGLGRLGAAWLTCIPGLKLAVANRDLALLLFAIPCIALLLVDQGEVERAVDAYALIASLPLVANSQLRWDLAGRYLAEAVSTLPPATVAGAFVRGQAKDLWAGAEALLLDLNDLAPIEGVSET